MGGKPFPVLKSKYIPTIAHGIKPLKSNQTAAVYTELSEDFSLFTKGSEAEPDVTDICDGEEIFGNISTIRPEYTKIPGWYGMYVYQAGGVAYVDNTPTKFGGLISTPYLDLSANNGCFHVRFKAKSINDKDTIVLWSVDSDNTAYYVETRVVTNEWKDFIVTLKGNESTSIQINSQSSGFFIDDIEVKSDAIQPPEFVTVYAYDGTSASVSWDSASGVKSYQASLYYLDEYENWAFDTSLTTTDTNCVFQSLDPSKEYAVTVASISEIEGDNPIASPLVRVLPIPKLLDATDVTPTSFTVNWEPVEKADSYSIRLSYRKKNAFDVWENEDFITNGISGNSLLMQGLDLLSRTYSYSVATIKDGFVGCYGLDKTVTPNIMAPVAKPATNVTKTGFTANWDAVADSEFPLTYGVSLYKEYTAKGNESYTLLDTDFSDITSGTIDNPVKVFYYPFDEGRWGSNHAALIDGMLGLNSEDGRGQLYNIYNFDFSQGHGAVAVDIKWKGNAGATNVSVYLTNTDTDNSYHSEPITTTLKESHIELKGATKGSQLIIEAESGIVYIDEIRVSMPLSAGEKIVTQVADEEVGNATSYDFKNITVPADYKLFYKACSIFRPQDRLSTTTKVSENVYVDLHGAVNGIELGGKATAYFADGAVRVVNPNGEKVEVYGISGVLVATSTGEEPIALPDGMYIVRIGSKSVKVVVRN